MSQLVSIGIIYQLVPHQPADKEDEMVLDWANWYTVLWKYTKTFYEGTLKEAEEEEDQR